MSTQMPTTLDNGRYQLGQLIGRGGMAQVYVAVDTRLGRTVAVKIMRADLAHDEIFLTRFRREAHSVAQMNNPNIVNIYDSGEEVVTLENGQTEHLPYLVMEYVQGQTLRDIIRANGPLSQRDAEHVMLGLLSALEYSHRMGIIHRDIKPGNIMISEQGVVKVMDFGIARALDDSATTMTKSQGVVGTAQYLSPEQARGMSVDMRSDLYSAGCVLYEMLTGRPPFTGDSAVAIAYQHVSEVATRPSAIVPGLPTMWDSICAKAMAKDRQNRYATATEFKNDILAYMNGGMPVAATFNPLTDLTATKAEKQAHDTANTVPYTSPVTEPGAPTQTFNPVTGQFEQVPGTGTQTAIPTRAQQRAALAKKKHKRRMIAIWVSVAVLAIACAIGGVIWWNVQRNAPKYVTVPTFSESTTEARARKQLTDLGLKADIKQDTDSTKPEGMFTKQSPAGGKRVEEGSTVEVWFSTGPKSVTVPDVTGDTQEAAREELEAAGFVVNTTVLTEDSSTIQQDHVTRTDPVAGTSQLKGSTISMWVSSGKTQVPTDLVGKTKDEAIEELGKQRFSVSVQEEASADVAEGSVIRTDPEGGTSVDQGAMITIWVSTGKPKTNVPPVTAGMTLAEAKRELEAANLTVNVDGDGSDDSIVESISPAAGTEVDEGSSVTVKTKKPESTPSPSPSNSDGSSSPSPSNSSSGN
ncbi:Stk1 family PASTA domain-containing Ser/Thr kinase [Bifidobacterium cuniculi]|uniref:non-specific serine/threonine protein kinase n=1 Tax=Bifidobacterium cuniculi TaxID=1688 RepID=A0A087ATF8_9BIFI|nr:Stk1 family PASTA domain-containing Ser/Thr kinase [Bifidobacterium cuniculi]KFI62058.1 serine-threonine protein kinase [Bifidobacterium cuniculi]